MNSEVPFRISVSDEKLALLKAKLDTVILPDELGDAGWAYGVPLTDIKRIVARWKNGFDWRVQEKLINELPQFTRDIEVDGFGSLNIHYVHQKSQAADAIPLLFVHGCEYSFCHNPSTAESRNLQGPGSFLEVRKILPLLTATSPEHPSFNVVAMSLPGYAFSEGPKEKGFGMAQYAEVCCSTKNCFWC